MSKCCETTGSARHLFWRLRSAITHADLDEEVFRRQLGIFHENIEVAFVLSLIVLQKL